jgi:hypothetical protein
MNDILQEVIFVFQILFFSMLAHTNLNADYFPSVGISIETSISPPFMPTQMSECKEYRESADNLIQELHNAHEECLKNHKYALKGSGKCAKPECESLHIARDSLRLEKTEQFALCKQKLKSNAAFVDSITGGSSGDEKDADDISVKYGEILKQSKQDVDRMIKKCESIHSVTDRKSCYSSVHQYADNARALIPNSSIVKAIQDYVSDKVKDHHDSLLEDMDSLTNQIDSFDPNNNNGQHLNNTRTAAGGDDFIGIDNPIGNEDDDLFGDGGDDDLFSSNNDDDLFGSNDDDDLFAANIGLEEFIDITVAEQKQRNQMKREQELERQRQAELQRQRRAEYERQRQRRAEYDRQRQAELERQQRIESATNNSSSGSGFGDIFTSLLGAAVQYQQLKNTYDNAKAKRRGKSTSGRQTIEKDCNQILIDKGVERQEKTAMKNAGPYGSCKYFRNKYNFLKNTMLPSVRSYCSSRDIPYAEKSLNDALYDMNAVCVGVR